MSKLNTTLSRITDLNKEATIKAQQHLDALTKPQGSLGVLEDIIKQLAGIAHYRCSDPHSKRNGHL